MAFPFGRIRNPFSGLRSGFPSPFRKAPLPGSGVLQALATKAGSALTTKAGASLTGSASGSPIYLADYLNALTDPMRASVASALTSILTT